MSAHTDRPTDTHRTVCPACRRAMDPRVRSFVVSSQSVPRQEAVRAAEAWVEQHGHESPVSSAVPYVGRQARFISTDVHAEGSPFYSLLEGRMIGGASVPSEASSACRKHVRSERSLEERLSDAVGVNTRTTYHGPVVPQTDVQTLLQPSKLRQGWYLRTADGRVYGDCFWATRKDAKAGLRTLQQRASDARVMLPVLSIWNDSVRPTSERLPERSRPATARTRDERESSWDGTSATVMGRHERPVNGAVKPSANPSARKRPGKSDAVSARLYAERMPVAQSWVTDPIGFIGNRHEQGCSHEGTPND